MYKEKYEKYRKNVDYIADYRKASNAATGSKYDSNANVEHKNITTCAGELTKGEKIGTNRFYQKCCDFDPYRQSMGFHQEYAGT